MRALASAAVEAAEVVEAAAAVAALPLAMFVAWAAAAAAVSAAELAAGVVLLRAPTAAVVASATGGLPEIVDDGETGVLVPPGDHDALAAALRRLADDPGEARRMGDRAAEVVSERFAPERMLRALEERYERLLHRQA